VSLKRAFARVDGEGRVSIPDNIRREAEIQPGQLVEVKVLAKKSIKVSATKSAR